MPENRWSHRSHSNLSTCDPRLRDLFDEVLKVQDCTVLCGYRDKAEQTEYFETGRSKLPWPRSQHNVRDRFPGRGGGQGSSKTLPRSEAVDVAPYPLDWKARRRFDRFAGIVLGVASQMGVAVRWGGDWDGDGDLTDQDFNDLVHFELDLDEVPP